MNAYEKRFKEIVAKCIKREGIDKVMESLEKSDFYTAPASTRHHGSHKHGLVMHSIAVFDRLVSEAKDKDYSFETLAIVALFHDICKVGFYKEDVRNVKENGKWIQVPYYTIDDIVPLGHGEKSVIMLMQHMRLKDDEILAIRWHMGLSVPKEDYNAMSKAFGECQLALYLHISDMKATYLDDEKGK